jgi:hypothetical protein
MYIILSVLLHACPPVSRKKMKIKIQKNKNRWLISNYVHPLGPRPTRAFIKTTCPNENAQHATAAIYVYCKIYNTRIDIITLKVHRLGRHLRRADDSDETSKKIGRPVCRVGGRTKHIWREYKKYLRTGIACGSRLLLTSFV